MTMRRTLLPLVLVATPAVVGCDADSDGADGGGQPTTTQEVAACHLVSSDPAFDGVGVSARQGLELHWSEAIDGATVESQVTLKALGGDPVPFSVEQTAPDTVVLHPESSLWFWTKYAILVGDGVASAGGGSCTGDEIAFSTLEPKPLDRPLRPAAADGIAKVGDYVITASASYRGLQVYDVSNPTATKLVGEVPTEQSPQGLTVVGDRAYAPAGVEGVLIFDVSSPAHPIQIGRAGTPGIALDVAEFSKNGTRYLAVADHWEGVRVLDVTDAAGPRDVGVIDPTGTHHAESWGVDVQGDLMAIADGLGGLALVDIADPTMPVMLSYTQDDYYLYDVVLAGDIAYTSRGPVGVRAWNISDRNAPVALENLPGPTTTWLDRIQRLVLDGGDLFAATGTVGVERVGLDGAGAMTLAAVQDVPGRAWSVAVDDDYVYAGAEAGLLVFDRAAPSGAAPVWFDPDGHGLAREVVLASGRAYVAAGSRGLQTYLPDAESGPTLIDQDDTPGMALDVAAGSIIATEKLIVLGDMRAGVVLYDRTNPDDPVQVGFIEGDDAIQGMQVVDDVLYACDSQTLIVADISDPSSPTVLARAPFEPGVGCSDVVVIGDTVLVGGSEGLALMDASDLASPEWLGWVPMSEVGGIAYMRLVGDRLLATFRTPDWEGTYDVSRKLFVFDVSNPKAPQLTWQSDDLGGVGELAVAGDIAFMAGGNRGVYVFDISDVGSPQLQGAIPTVGNAIGVALDEEALYVAQGNGGLVVVPLGALPPH